MVHLHLKLDKYSLLGDKNKNKKKNNNKNKSKQKSQNKNKRNVKPIMSADELMNLEDPQILNKWLECIVASGNCAKCSNGLENNKIVLCIQCSTHYCTKCQKGKKFDCTFEDCDSTSETMISATQHLSNLYHECVVFLDDDRQVPAGSARKKRRINLKGEDNDKQQRLDLKAKLLTQCRLFDMYAFQRCIESTFVKNLRNFVLNADDYDREKDNFEIILNQCAQRKIHYLFGYFHYDHYEAVLDKAYELR